jgi:hypothetical protein
MMRRREWGSTSDLPPSRDALQAGLPPFLLAFLALACCFIYCDESRDSLS